MGNKTGLDMGYSFQFTFGPFHGHVVERNGLCGKAVAVCEIGFEGPTKHGATVSGFRVQSQERL